MPYVSINKPRRVDPASLIFEPYRRNVTSQCGEDGVIERIFQIIGAQNAWCVEFGAWDGKLHSNTWTLIQQRNWTGVLIEGDKNRFGELQRTHQAKRSSTHLFNGFVGIEPGSTLDDFLVKASAPTDIDFVCIDIDGNDWHVWKSLTRFRPRVVEIEFNPSVPNHISFVQDYGREIKQGCSLAALIELGKSKGYELIAATDWNAFFVIKELMGKFGIQDNSIDALYEPKMIIEIFQGYDGTIFPVGSVALYWLGVPLSFEDFQVLPRAMRRYRDSP
jgi:Methyltransferase FkbM domain